MNKRVFNMFQVLCVLLLGTISTTLAASTKIRGPVARHLKEAPSRVYSGSCVSDTTAFNGKLYWRCDDGIGGAPGVELFEYDGTNAPKWLTTGNIFPSNLIVFNNKLYFQAIDFSNGIRREWWVYDGITPPAVELSLETFSATDPGSVAVFNGKLVFSGRIPNSIGAYDLWEYDGVSARRWDTVAGPQLLTVFNGKLYFKTVTSSENLWAYDGVNAPTLAAGYPAGFLKFSAMVVFNNKLLLWAVRSNGGFSDYEPWEYDGVNAPTLVADINPGTGGGCGSLCISTSRPTFMVFNSKAYFKGYDGIREGLWVYDGTNAPSLVSSTVVPLNQVDSYGVFEGCLFFNANDRLYRYDGVDDLVLLSAADRNPGFFVTLNGKLYFRTTGTQQQQPGLWVLNGSTSTGTPAPTSSANAPTASPTPACPTDSCSERIRRWVVNAASSVQALFAF